MCFNRDITFVSFSKILKVDRLFIVKFFTMRISRISLAFSSFCLDIKCFNMELIERTVNAFFYDLCQLRLFIFIFVNANVQTNTVLIEQDILMDVHK